MKLVLDYSNIHENHWFELHRKHHHYKMQQNCFICIHIQKLWFTNSTVQIMEQDWILWIGYLHGVYKGEIYRTFILFSGETWLYFSGCMNSHSNMFLILIPKCNYMVVVWYAMNSTRIIGPTFFTNTINSHW